MSTTPRTGPPAGMPAHLWEIAKRDVRTLIPERLRDAQDGTASAPRAVRAVARRVAAMAAVLGAASTIRSFADDPEVALAGTASPLGDAGPAPGELDPSPTVPGGGDGTPFGHVGSHAEGTPVDAGLGSTWTVSTDDGSGHVSVLTVQLFQDVVVVENADGTFSVVADQVIRIVDPDGHEHVFHDHYEVVVPDPPGQETDLSIHEDGQVRLVENPDGSFTPIVDHTITITAGADGDGRDEVSVDQDETVTVHDHDPHHGDVVRVDESETASSTSHDTGDEATSTIHQDEAVLDGARHGVDPDGGSTRHRPETGASGTGASAGSSSVAGTSSPAASSAASSAVGSAVVGTVAADTVVPLASIGDSPSAGWHLDDPVAGHGTPSVGSTDADPGPAPTDPVFTGGHVLDTAPTASAGSGESGAGIDEHPTPPGANGTIPGSGIAAPEGAPTADGPDATGSGGHPTHEQGPSHTDPSHTEHPGHLDRTDHANEHDALDPAGLG